MTYTICHQDLHYCWLTFAGQDYCSQCADQYFDLRKITLDAARKATERMKTHSPAPGRAEEGNMKMIPITGPASQGNRPNPYAIRCPQCGAAIGQYCAQSWEDGVGYIAHPARRKAWQQQYGEATQAVRTGSVPAEDCTHPERPETDTGGAMPAD